MGNYDSYMKTDLSSYIGQWVAFCENELVSHGKNVKKVFSEVKKKYPNKRPFITKVPEKETMIF